MVGLAVDLLTKQMGRDLLTPCLASAILLKRLLSNGQHAARAARAVVQQVRPGLNLVGDRQKHQVRHQPLPHHAGSSVRLPLRLLSSC